MSKPKIKEPEQVAQESPLTEAISELKASKVVVGGGKAGKAKVLKKIPLKTAVKKARQFKATQEREHSLDVVIEQSEAKGLKVPDILYKEQARRKAGKRPTLKQRQWAQAIVAGLPPLKATKEIYEIDTNKPKDLSSSVARNLTHQNLTAPNGQLAIREALIQAGIGTDRLNSKLSSLLEAQKTIVIDKEGVEVSDNPTQLAAVQTGYKLHGLLSGNDGTVDNRQVNITVNQVDTGTLNNIINNIERMQSKLAKDQTQDGEIT